MKAKVTEQGLTLKKEWFDGCPEVEIVKSGSALLITPIARAPANGSESSPDDPIWSLARDPLVADALTNGSVRHDEIIYNGR